MMLNLSGKSNTDNKASGRDGDKSGEAGRNVYVELWEMKIKKGEEEGNGFHTLKGKMEQRWFAIVRGREKQKSLDL